MRMYNFNFAHFFCSSTQSAKGERTTGYRSGKYSQQPLHNGLINHNCGPCAALDLISAILWICAAAGTT